MNDRIEQLAKQATRIEEPDGLFPREVFDKEKFAELIVQECADLFEVEWGEEKLTGNDVGYVVRKHFGVEE